MFQSKGLQRRSKYVSCLTLHAPVRLNRTGLYLASKNGHVDVVKVLLENGAEVNAFEVNGVKYIPLYIAARGGHVDVVKVLIHNGADVDCKALHMASQQGHADVAKVLLENGADVNAVDGEKFTALHWAAIECNADIAKVLIQYGADVNAVDEEDATVLHHALANEDLDTVKVLLQNGADVNAVDGEGSSQLDTAPSKDNVYSLLLLCFGADINTVETKKKDRTLQFNGFIYSRVEDPKLVMLRQIKAKLDLLRAGKRIGTSLMSKEESQFMWNLAFSFTWKYRAAAFKAYYAIRSFITFHGIFMACEYDLGEESIWRKSKPYKQGELVVVGRVDDSEEDSSQESGEESYEYEDSDE